MRRTGVGQGWPKRLELGSSPAVGPLVLKRLKSGCGRLVSPVAIERPFGVPHRVRASSGCDPGFHLRDIANHEPTTAASLLRPLTIPLVRQEVLHRSEEI